MSESRLPVKFYLYLVAIIAGGIYTIRLSLGIALFILQYSEFDLINQIIIDYVIGTICSVLFTGYMVARFRALKLTVDDGE